MFRKNNNTGKLQTEGRSLFWLLGGTFFLMVVLIAVFELVMTNGFLSDAFTHPKDIHQNVSTYIDAIGNIAIGLAGAIVAIKLRQLRQTYNSKIA